jgi:hypothetical protein
VIARVFKDDSRLLLPDATGIAAEERAPAGSRVPNESSWWENCETSAIGRALANMGYATSSEDRPSREEMEKVNAYDDRVVSVQSAEVFHQAPTPYEVARAGPAVSDKATGPQLKAIGNMGHAAGYDSATMIEMWGNAELLTKRQASDIIDGLKKQLDDLNKGN